MTDEKTEVKSGVTVNKEAVFIGDFEFKFQGNLIKQYMEWKDACNGDVTEYEQTAKELMAKHYAFYGQFQKENKYVKSGSVLWCSGGSKLTAFDILHDHGVVQKDGTPMGICTDCKANENIYTFEGCKIPASAGYPERPVVTVKSQPQAILYKCIPMLNGSWSKSKSSKIKIWDESTGKYVDAITTGDFLTCFYGGIIEIIEVPKVNRAKGSGNMTFSGASWLEKAERKVPYIYSTKDPSYAQWTGGFNSNADLTFGIGHCIKSASEFSQISNFVATHSQADIETEIQRYLQNDLSGSVTQVNNFLKNNGITLQQHQFDAVVSLVFNYPASLSSSTDLGKELIANGNSGNFNQQNIIDGFTYTKFQGSRIDGLVTRRNNELNLFFKADYNNYYDSKSNVIAAGIDHIKY
jgi:GH24 family phage-related lysozyme (muramidase)